MKKKQKITQISIEYKNGKIAGQKLSEFLIQYLLDMDFHRKVESNGCSNKK